MTDIRWRQGMVIKGKMLEGVALCKILSKNMTMKGFQYRLGMNEDYCRSNVDIEHGTMGLHFSSVQDIQEYLDYGVNLAVVTVPDNEDIYVDAHGFHAFRINIAAVLPLDKAPAWEFLTKNGAVIAAKEPSIICHTAQKGYYEAVKYLYENGADITVRNHFAVRWAAKNGHLEVVKYLHKHGADITAFDQFAVRWAAAGGHLDVVKYLHQNGADITAHNNDAICCAAAGGHLAVVKYLHQNGADITACNRAIIKWAAKYGYVEMVQYLHKYRHLFTSKAQRFS